MRNLLFAFLLLIFTSISFSQIKATIKCSADISCSQKNGTTLIDREYTLTVIFDNKEIKFTTHDNQSEKGMNKYDVTKKTEKYIVASNKEGNYAFYNIKRKQFYYIDYYMNRYISTGYGSQTSEVKQNVEKMIELLKSGRTQKDVIQYLIKQVEYDF